jgi:hypothetical protein
MLMTDYLNIQSTVYQVIKQSFNKSMFQYYDKITFISLDFF